MKNNKGFTLIELLVVVAIIVFQPPQELLHTTDTLVLLKKAKTIHANLIKYVAAEYSKCTIDDSDTIMKKGGAGGIACSDTNDAGNRVRYCRRNSYSSNRWNALEDKNPYSTASAAVRSSTSAGAEFVSITATSDNLITVLTCFTDGKTGNECTDTGNQLTNTISID